VDQIKRRVEVLAVEVIPFVFTEIAQLFVQRDNLYVTTSAVVHAKSVKMASADPVHRTEPVAIIAVVEQTKCAKTDIALARNLVDPIAVDQMKFAPTDNAVTHARVTTCYVGPSAVEVDNSAQMDNASTAITGFATTNAADRSKSAMQVTARVPQPELAEVIAVAQDNSAISKL